MNTCLPVKTILWQPKVRNEKLESWNHEDFETVSTVNNHYFLMVNIK